MKTLPGCLWINRGRWHWKVHLPGTPVRKNYPLRIPGQSVAIPEKKGRSLAESVAWRMWEAASRKPQEKTAGITLEAACARFLSWSDTYYRRADGEPTGETYNCEIALRSLRARHGNKPLDDLIYQDVLDLRDEQVAEGHCRTTINQRVGVWKRFIAWALENRLCSATTKSEVWAITSLKRGRTTAPEGQPIYPVKHIDVKRILPYLPPILRAMVTVHELCGARPSEICGMRPCDIEQRHGVWVYRPASHKTEHKGAFRVICLGPRAQALMAPYLDGDPSLPVFRPTLAEAERAAQKRQERKTKVQPSQAARRPKRNPLKAPSEQYDTQAYGRAITYAILAARENGVSVSSWSPNQLRHACGTRVRRKFGPDAARAVLGHTRQAGVSRITDTYTRQALEAETIKAASKPMRAIG